MRRREKPDFLRFGSASACGRRPTVYKKIDETCKILNKKGGLGRAGRRAGLLDVV